MGFPARESNPGLLRRQRAFVQQNGNSDVEEYLNLSCDRGQILGCPPPALPAKATLEAFELIKMAPLHQHVTDGKHSEEEHIGHRGVGRPSHYGAFSEHRPPSSMPYQSASLPRPWAHDSWLPPLAGLPLAPILFQPVLPVDGDVLMASCVMLVRRVGLV